VRDGFEDVHDVVGNREGGTRVDHPRHVYQFEQIACYISPTLAVAVAV
jgi:hypothetical protein